MIPQDRHTREGRPMTRTLTRWALGLVAPTALAACTHRIAVDPIKVEPIDITLHIYLEADEKLDSFFNYQDQAASPPEEPPVIDQVPSEGGTR
jgi:hypothetical protein